MPAALFLRPAVSARLPLLPGAKLLAVLMDHEARVGNGYQGKQQQQRLGNIVIDKITKMNEANVQLGNTYIDNPISRITILSLLVCPYVKISDKGIVLTEEKAYVSLFN